MLSAHKAKTSLKLRMDSGTRAYSFMTRSCIGSKSQRRLFSDSARVGWAKMALRNWVSVRLPIIAI